MEGSNIGGGGGGALAAKLSNMSPWSLLTPAAGAQGKPNGGRSSRAGNFAFGKIGRLLCCRLYGSFERESEQRDAYLIVLLLLILYRKPAESAPSV